MMHGTLIACQVFNLTMSKLPLHVYTDNTIALF